MTLIQPSPVVKVVESGEIRVEGSVPVFEEIKVRWSQCPGQVLTGHADECAGEIGSAGHGCFVGEYSGVEELRQPAPGLVLVQAFDTVGEAEALVIDFDM